MQFQNSTYTATRGGVIWKIELTHIRIQLGHVLLAIQIRNLEITRPYEYGLHTIFTLRSENQFSAGNRAFGEHLVEVLESLRDQYV